MRLSQRVKKNLLRILSITFLLTSFASALDMTGNWTEAPTGNSDADFNNLMGGSVHFLTLSNGKFILNECTQMMTHNVFLSGSYAITNSNIVLKSKRRTEKHSGKILTDNLDDQTINVPFRSINGVLHLDLFNNGDLKPYLNKGQVQAQIKAYEYLIQQADRNKERLRQSMPKY